MRFARSTHAPLRLARRRSLDAVVAAAAVVVTCALAGCEAGPSQPKAGGLSCFEVVKTWNARLDVVIETEAAAEAAKDYEKSNKYTRMYNQIVDERAAALAAAGC